MKYGYIRVSSPSQTVERQREAMKGIELDFVFEEKASGIKFDRPQLQKMLRTVKRDDVIYITELSRLSRSCLDLCKIVNEIMSKGVSLVSLRENIDLSTPYGKAFYQMMGVFAEYERACIKERQREGIAAAKAKGKRWGREKQYALDEDLNDKVFLSYLVGEIDSKEACAQLANIPYHAFLYRYHKWADANGYDIPDGRRKKDL